MLCLPFVRVVFDNLVPFPLSLNRSRIATNVNAMHFARRRQCSMQNLWGQPFSAEIKMRTFCSTEVGPPNDAQNATPGRQWTYLSNY